MKYVEIPLKGKSFFLRVGDEKAYREIMKYLLIYPNTKKRIFVRFVLPLYLKGLIGRRKDIPYKYNLIISGNNIKMFGLDRKEVITLYNIDAEREKVCFMKDALRNMVSVPKVIESGFQMIKEEYLDFSFLSFGEFRRRSKEILRIMMEIYKKFDVIEMSAGIYLRKIDPAVLRILNSIYGTKDIEKEKIMLVFSHSDFHPANFPVYKNKFYLLDLGSFSYKPLLYDFLSFAYIPLLFKMPLRDCYSIFNSFLSNSKLFEKIDPDFADKEELYLKLSTAIFRSGNLRLQRALRNNFVERFLKEKYE